MENNHFLIKKKNLPMKLHRKTFKAEKINLVLLGDEHIGSKYHDSESLKRNVDWMMNSKDTYMIGMGDMLETATKDSVGGGVFEQNKIVDEQIDHAVKIYKPLADAGKILGLHRGNHEERVFKHSGADLTKIMAKLLKVKNFGIGFAHKLRVGDQTYLMYTTHGHSGSRLPHTKIKACIDLANMIDVQIYAMGHLHQLSHHVRQYYKINTRRNSVEEFSNHFLLTGSYLNHWGSYAQESGYEMMRKGSPKIKLSGLENQIRVSLG